MLLLPVDSIPALFVLEAKLVLQKGEKIHEVKIEDFFKGVSKTILEKGEIILKVYTSKDTKRLVLMV